MKIILNYLLITLLFFGNTIIGQEDSGIVTVDTVDLEKYTGKWYEISKIPNSFQDQCIKNTTANYSINEAGDIIVLNKCIDDEGEVDDAEGLARIVDKKTNSKLEVSFVNLFGWRLFWGDYWIIELDEDYKYVAVATPSRKYGWILSRNPKMIESDLTKCYQAFEKNGYDINKFEMSIQEY